VWHFHEILWAIRHSKCGFLLIFYFFGSLWGLYNVSTAIFTNKKSINHLDKLQKFNKINILWWFHHYPLHHFSLTKIVFKHNTHLYFCRISDAIGAKRSARFNGQSVTLCINILCNNLIFKRKNREYNKLQPIKRRLNPFFAIDL
jgi:hypothetical protein